jgi:DNA polymerase-3 subunit gamma/tau
MAVLEIENDIHFTVRVPGLTAQKFVEQERMMLIDEIFAAFNNRSIKFSIIVDATEKEDVPIHMRLNSKQKFERISEQYPLVKELKEKLKLEIDY